MNARRFALSFVAMIAAVGTSLHADNWPAWRGPQRNGISTETNLPLRWSKEAIQLGGETYSAADHVPVMIYPSPLNTGRYVVLNSGHTFRTADFEGTNARLFPRLGDYAVLQPTLAESDPASVRSRTPSRSMTATDPDRSARPVELRLAAIMTAIVLLQAAAWASGQRGRALAEAVERGAARVERRSVGEVAEADIRRAIDDQRATLRFWAALAAVGDFAVEPMVPAVRAVLAASGFAVKPYHAAVPSFGIWGFGLAKRESFEAPHALPPGITYRYLNDRTLPALFALPTDLGPVETEINRLDNQALVRYYERY